MNLQYFGTDGIRGTYGTVPITESFASQVAAGLVMYLARHVNREGPTRSVVMARDTRFSGPALSAAFAAVLEGAGIQVHDLGVVPTPQVAFATSFLQADLGLAITASHNPVSDNGFKLFRSDGTKFAASQEAEIEACIQACARAVHPVPSMVEPFYHATALGKRVTQSYFEILNRRFRNVSLQGFSIVVDTANGATCATTPAFLDSLGAQVHVIANQPDGHNINQGVGSEHPEALRQTVLQKGADLGIAHDGDGDRVQFVDSDGSMVSGEHFLAILARYSPTLACSSDRALVTTTMSNFALDAYLQQSGIPVVRTDVGDRNVAECMRERDCMLGGENSGHFICGDVLGSGDGLVAVLKLLETLRATNRSLQDLCSEMPLYPSSLLNLHIRKKLELSSLPTLVQATRKAEEMIDGKGRVLLRYSGTENKLRILVECASESMMKTILSQLEAAARADLEVTP